MKGKGANHVAEETKKTQVDEESETTETETFIEEVEVKRTRKGPSKASSASTAATAEAKKGESYKVTVPLLNIREKASLVAEVIGTLQEGDIVEITAKTPMGFGKLADDEGYVKLDYVEKIENTQ